MQKLGAQRDMPSTIRHDWARLTLWENELGGSKVPNSKFQTPREWQGVSDGVGRRKAGARESFANRGEKNYFLYPDLVGLGRI